MNMLETLKQAGKNIGRELGRTWENLSEGWRELLSRSSDALTHFVRSKDTARPESAELATFPRWSLLAGEVEETAGEIVVRVEAPGMEKKDFIITVEGNMLYLSGEKHYQREAVDSTYHIMERAYGAFQRSIPLPRNVEMDKAEASYRNGVLTIRLPKSGSPTARNIPLS
jgi:HSP20 family protein